MTYSLKRKLSLMVIALLILSLAAPYYVLGTESTPNAEFLVGVFKIEQDGTETVPIKLNLTNGKLYGADIVINYDSSIAAALSVDKGSLLSNFSVVSNIDNPGQIRIAIAGASPLESSGEILKLRFKLNDRAILTNSVDIVKAEVNENAIPSTSNLLIDFNKDKIINIFDIVPVARDYNMQDTDLDWNSLYDLNEDGVVNLLDLLKVAKYME